FGTNGMETPEISAGDDFAYAIVEQPDHKIILAGTALDNNAYNAPVVVRLNENGSIDSTFGINGVATITPIFIDNELTSVVLQPDGKIVVSGHLDQGLTGGGQFSFEILTARFDTNGVADNTFGTNGVATTAIGGLVDDAFGLQVTPTGNILVSGFTTLPNFSYDAVLLQYDSTGTLDPNFGNQGIVQYNYGDMDVAFDVEVQNDGNILIAGIAGAFVPADNDFMLSRYTSNGVLDSTFGTNGVSITPLSPQYDEAEAMALQADGKIVLAGKSNNGVQNDIAVARFINDISSAINETPAANSISLFPNPVSKGQPLFVNIEVKSSAKIEIYNLIGNLVMQKNLTPNDNHSEQLKIELPTSIVPGMYFVKISEGATVVSRKFLVTDK
nr:T9SS type A sorting domain-containing protein [Bacteroidia bacterium]